ncbi:MAG: hypothetical protein N2450_08350 [bacterium]|nr:hypothetical protein [bacterium]
MNDILLLIVMVLSIWGALLFLTLKVGLITARNTIELGLRKRRLQLLRYRFLLGCTIGLLLLGLTLHYLVNTGYTKETFVLYLAFSCICLSEMYFWLRYLQLYKNFRKYSTKFFQIDTISPYFSLSGTILSILSILTR